MNINSVSNSINRSISGLNLRRRIFEMLPTITIPNADTFNKIGRVISRPDVNRAIMGATAIVTQPFIDYFNPKVDRDTATVSTFRTIGKIIAGTTVGCAVRSACYYGTKMLTNTAKTAPSWQKLLLPSEKIMRYLNMHHPDWLKNHNSVVSTVIGLLAMLVTNVMLDVPLTNKISKSLIDRFKKNKADSGDQTPAKVEPYDVREKFINIFVHNPIENKEKEAKS